MKKTLFRSFLLLLLMPTFLYATSGACSGHGGVSCASGSDSDGSVICNDGWENSSVSYSSMVMCEGYSSSKPTSVPVPVKNRIPDAPTSSIGIPKKSIETPQPVITPETKKTTTSQGMPAQEILPKVSAVVSIATPVQKQSFWRRLFNSIFND